MSSLRQGEQGVIAEWRLDREDAALLKAMGLCTHASVKVVRTGQPCVVAVGGIGEAAEANCSCGGMCRIGLARDLAERIMVAAVA